jgi:hypothetical protein
VAAHDPPIQRMQNRRASRRGPGGLCLGVKAPYAQPRPQQLTLKSALSARSMNTAAFTCSTQSDALVTVTVQPAFICSYTLLPLPAVAVSFTLSALTHTPVHPGAREMITTFSRHESSSYRRLHVRRKQCGRRPSFKDHFLSPRATLLLKLATF